MLPTEVEDPYRSTWLTVLRYAPSTSSVATQDERLRTTRRVLIDSARWVPLSKGRDAAAPLLFAHHLARDRRRSPHTVRAYAATAERLIAFLQGHWGGRVDAAALGRLSAADLRAFLASRRAEGLGNAGAARELSAVRGFIAFAGGAAPPLRGPRVAKTVPRPVSPTKPSRWPGKFPMPPPNRGSARATGRSCCCSMARGCASARHCR